MKKRIFISAIVLVCLMLVAVGIIISANDSDNISININSINDDGTIEILVDGVSKGNAPQTIEVDKTSTITLRTASENFLFYTDSDYRTVCEEGEFSFTANKYGEINVFNKNTNDEAVFVIYRNTDDAKQVMHAELYYELDKFTTLTDKIPSKFGKVFTGWDKTVDEIKALQEKNVFVYPVYENTLDTVTVSVVGGTINGEASAEIVKGTQFTLVADEPNTGYKLNNLINSQSKHISFDSEVTLTATIDETYTFKFITEETAISTQVPKVFLNFNKDSSSGKTEIISNRIVPEGYTNVISGLIYAVDYDGMDKMIIESVDGTNLRYLEHASSDSSEIFVNKISFNNYAYVRPFIKYTDATDGAKISYGDITTLTKDALAVNYYIDDVTSFKMPDDIKYYTYQRTYDKDNTSLSFDVVNKALSDNADGAIIGKQQCFVYLYTVYALYQEDAENTRTITVYNGTVDGEVTQKVEVGTTVQIKAGEQEGKIFAYFEDISGNRITNKSQFEATIYDDTEYRAVFFGANEVKTYLPYIRLGFDRDADENVIFVSFVDVKDLAYGSVKSGIVYTNDETKKDLLTIDNVDDLTIFKKENELATENGFLTVNTELTGNLYAQSYIEIGEKVFYSASLTVKESSKIVPIIYTEIDNVTATGADLTVYKYISDRLNYVTGGLLFIKDYTANIVHYLDNYKQNKAWLNKVFFADKSQTPFTYHFTYSSFLDYKIFVDYTDAVYYSPERIRVPSTTENVKNVIEPDISLSFFRDADSGKVKTIYNRFLFEGTSNVKTGVLYIKDSDNVASLTLDNVDGINVFKTAEIVGDESDMGIVSIDYQDYAYVCGYIEIGGEVKYTDITKLDGMFMAESYYLDGQSVGEKPTGDNLVAYARTAKSENWLTYDILDDEYNYADELDPNNTHVLVYFTTVSKVYDTKADLNADLENLEALSIVGVRRYYNYKKGTSTIFKVTTSSDTKTLTVVPFTCGSKKVVTPEMYGAKGDGIASDSSAINSALSASANICEFQSEQYKQTGRINLAKDNYILNGNMARIFNSYSSMVNDDFKITNSENMVVRGLWLDCTELTGSKLSGGGDHIQLRFCEDSKNNGCRYVTINNILLTARPNPEDYGRRVGSCWVTDSDDVSFINSIIVNRSKSSLHSAGLWFSASAEVVEDGKIVTEATTVHNFVVAYNYIEKSSHDEVLAFFIGNVDGVNVYENTLYTHNEPTGDASSAHMIGFGVADNYTLTSNVVFRNNIIDGVGRKDCFMFSACQNIKIYDNQITYRNNSATDMIEKGLFRDPGSSMLAYDREIIQENVEIYNNDISVISKANLHRKGYNIGGLFTNLSDGFYIHDNTISVSGYLNSILNSDRGAIIENNIFELERKPITSSKLDSSNTIYIAGVKQ